MSDKNQTDQIAEALSRRMNGGIVLFAFLTLACLFFVYLRDDLRAEWRQIRKIYAKILKGKADSALGKDLAERFEIRVVQNALPELGRIDRCVTCHTGSNDPRMSDQAEPFATHPGRYLAVHPPERFGCTICHEGQGEAIDKADAHGRVSHWPEPLLSKDLMKSTCAQCHEEEDLYDEGLLFALDHEDEKGKFEEDEEEDGDEKYIKSGELLIAGRDLSNAKGCLGCHVLSGRGGPLGPDITRIAEKTGHEYDFSRFEGDEPRDVEHWLMKHFLQPLDIAPDTFMPTTGFSERQAEAITAYMLSLRNREIIPATFRFSIHRESPLELSGARLYAKFCSACHGETGLESEVPGIRTPMLHNVDAQSLADEAYYRAIISEGRREAKMPAWERGGGNLTGREIDRVVGFLRQWGGSGASVAEAAALQVSPRVGEFYYQGLCANCHGTEGEGGVGISLNSASFLATASKAFLAESIIEGRPGTAMPTFRNISAREAAQFAAYMVQWAGATPSFEEVRAIRDSGSLSREAGERLFSEKCSVCHGDEGQGGIGVSLSTADLAHVVSDQFLYDTLTQGRPETAMPAWGRLEAEQLAALVDRLRRWGSGSRARRGAWGAEGRADVGGLLFGEFCASCHGDRGSGGAAAPAIANEFFIRAVSDEALTHWIGKGREGTPMKGFLSFPGGLALLTPERVADLIAYLRFEAAQHDRFARTPGSGDPVAGLEAFGVSCAPCHGERGEGDVDAPQINNPVFLRAASDGFLKATLILGRMGTPMRALPSGIGAESKLELNQIPDILAFMREWETAPSAHRPRPLASDSEKTIALGFLGFRRFCGGCHGLYGRAERDGRQYFSPEINNSQFFNADPDSFLFAPALNNPSFLKAASDGFIFGTIIRGRSATPMRPFGQGAEVTDGMEPLEKEKMLEILSYIRSWE